MKKLWILSLLVLLSPAFATVTIDGYVDACPSCEAIADCGRVILYDVGSGGRPIDYCCISPNGYYSFEVSENDTFYIEIEYAQNADYPHGVGGCLDQWWKDTDRVTVIVATSDVTQDLCADEVGTLPWPPPCDCETK